MFADAPEVSGDLRLFFTKYLQEDVADEHQRNRLIGFLMLRSDELVNKHHQRIFGSSAGGNLLLGNAAALASGTSAALSAASTKTALASASTFFQTSKGLWNDEVFYGILAGKIVETIITKREMLRAGIRSDMRKTMAEFNIGEAIVALETYHNAGSFQRGLMNLLGDGVRTKSAYELVAEHEALSKLGGAAADARKKVIEEKLSIDR